MLTSKPPLLSVVVPIHKMDGKLFNLSLWLHKSHHFPFQIILVHDIRDELCSSELSQLVAKCDNKRIELIEGNFGGPGLARSRGLARATGNWVAFWDSDDVPQLSAIFSTLNKSQEADVIIGGYSIVQSSGNRSYFGPLGKGLSGVLGNPGVWRMIFSQAVSKKIVFPDLRMAEDQIMLAMLGLPSLELKFEDVDFYHYFLGVNNQLTSNKSALNELSRAVTYTSKIMFTQKGAEQIFTYSLLTSQTVAAMKKCSPKYKISVLACFLSYSVKLVFVSRNFLYPIIGAVNYFRSKVD